MIEFRPPNIEEKAGMLTISDKWKAVVAAAGAFVLTLNDAIGDGNVSLNETGLIVGATVALGLAVWRVRNRPAT